LRTFPKVVGGSDTLMFFGHIANLGEADFYQRYRSITSDELHGDLVKQIWRSSQILAAKYYWLKVASISLPCRPPTGWASSRLFLCRQANYQSSSELAPLVLNLFSAHRQQTRTN
jgi:hypothetical protein